MKVDVLGTLTIDKRRDSVDGRYLGVKRRWDRWSKAIGDYEGDKDVERKGMGIEANVKVKVWCSLAE